MKQIPLTQGKVALVDDTDYEELSKYRWCSHKHGKTFYVVRMSPMIKGKRNFLRMHTVIMNPPEGKEIDHINGDGLDNRRENLRIVSHRTNQQNRHENKTSRYPGVSWCKQHKKWKAQIHLSGANTYLGYFDVEEDAARAYVKACEDLLTEEKP